MGFSIIGLAVATTIGIYILGILTVNYIKRQFDLPLNNLMITKTLFLNIFLGGIGLAFVQVLRDMGNFQFLISLAVLECLMVMAYLYFYRRLNARWIVEGEKRIFEKSKKPIKS
jgi:hypothetical protein